MRREKSSGRRSPHCPRNRRLCSSSVSSKAILIRRSLKSCTFPWPPWNPAFTGPNSTSRRSLLPCSRTSAGAASFEPHPVSKGVEMKKDNSGRNGACVFIRSHLISIAERDSTGAAFPGIRDHLDSCPECASLVQQFSRAWETPAPPEDAQPSPTFFPRLIERIEAGEKPLPGRRDVL